ncbi:MAG: TIGR03936 family radical SAM-associated protein, partial [Deltaproteobacteria bacterium]|nr:TIGR03936 family radical SAM-associated protein [Deltaproteobacteria bacterium]
VAGVFDAFYLGDAEESLVNVLRIYKSRREAGKSKMEILEELSQIDGVYVPALFDIKYNGLYLQSEPAKKVRRAVALRLDINKYPDMQIVPLTETVQDRFVVEIQRGCTHSCRFCYAGYIYRPVRQRSGSDIFRIVTDGIRKSGFQEVSFLSLSAGDYRGLEKILKRLNENFRPDKISLSLPSLRVDTASGELVQEISRVKKTGITIAPEAGSEQMRRKINKNIKEEDIIKSVETAFLYGWEMIKLYFMIGLPGETDEDVQQILSLSYKVLETARRYKKRPDISITVSPFIPKPHTPLQWEGMESSGELQRKFSIIRKGLSHPAFKIKKVNLPLAAIEALLSRGDRRVLDIILDASRRGSYLDAWSDNFDITHYLKSETEFKEKYNLGISDYLGRRDKNQPLPWDIFSTGVSKDYLISEYDKYQSGAVTEDCFTDICSNCGVCDSSVKIVRANVSDLDLVSANPKPLTDYDEKMTYYRIQYSKEGDIIYASQLDMINIFTKALMMSGLPVLFRGEFNPRVELSSGPALPVGVISTTEFMDFALKKCIPNDYTLKILSRFLPAGIRILNILSSDRRMKSVSQSVAAARYDVYMPLIPSDEDIKRVLDSQEIKVIRKKGETSKEVDIRGFIHDIRKEENCLRIFLLYKEDGTANIFEVLRVFREFDKSSVTIRKDRVYFSVSDI